MLNSCALVGVVTIWVWCSILAGQILRTADKLQMPSDVPKVRVSEERGRGGRGSALFSEGALNNNTEPAGISIRILSLQV